MNLMNQIFVLFLVLYILPIAQGPMNEKVKFLIDSWKYNFGWETLGGGYIRHILLFTENHIIDIKTNHVSHLPRPNAPTIFVEPSSDKLYLLPLNAILNTLLEKILESPQKEMDDEMKSVINTASENPTAENYFKALSSVLNRKNLRCEIKEIIPYSEIKEIEPKAKGNELHLKFKYKNKKYEFISNYDNPKSAEEIKISLMEIFKTQNPSK